MRWGLNFAHPRSAIPTSPLLMAGRGVGLLCGARAAGSRMDLLRGRGLITSNPKIGEKG